MRVGNMSILTFLRICHRGGGEAEVTPLPDMEGRREARCDNKSSLQYVGRRTLDRCEKR
jgi:hypothetical protein